MRRYHCLVIGSFFSISIFASQSALTPTTLQQQLQTISTTLLNLSDQVDSLCTSTTGTTSSARTMVQPYPVLGTCSIPVQNVLTALTITINNLGDYYAFTPDQITVINNALTQTKDKTVYINVMFDINQQLAEVIIIGAVTRKVILDFTYTPPKGVTQKGNWYLWYVYQAPGFPSSKWISQIGSAQLFNQAASMSQQ